MRVSGRVSGSPAVARETLHHHWLCPSPHIGLPSWRKIRSPHHGTEGLGGPVSLPQNPHLGTPSTTLTKAQGSPGASVSCWEGLLPPPSWWQPPPLPPASPLKTSATPGQPRRGRSPATRSSPDRSTARGRKGLFVLGGSRAHLAAWQRRRHWGNRPGRHPGGPPEKAHNSGAG